MRTKEYRETFIPRFDAVAAQGMVFVGDRTSYFRLKTGVAPVSEVKPALLLRYLPMWSDDSSL